MTKILYEGYRAGDDGGRWVGVIDTKPGKEVSVRNATRSASTGHFMSVSDPKPPRATSAIHQTATKK